MHQACQKPCINFTHAVNLEYMFIMTPCIYYPVKSGRYMPTSEGGGYQQNYEASLQCFLQHLTLQDYQPLIFLFSKNCIPFSSLVLLINFKKFFLLL